MNQEEIIESLNNFEFKACKIGDEKTAKVYKNLKKEAKQSKPKIQASGTAQSKEFKLSSFA